MLVRVLALLLILVAGALGISSEWLPAVCLWLSARLDRLADNIEAR